MGEDNLDNAVGPPQRPAPRELQEIFDDLRALCQSPGALHEISHLVYRDWILTVDTHEGRVVDGPQERWSTSKLNNNELMLLLGLIVQSASPQIYSVVAEDQSFEEHADRLLREFHDRLLVDAAAVMDPETGTIKWHPEAVALMGREAIYYGADSFYPHQFQKFSRHRYKDDAAWLLKNTGISIRSMIDIALFISNRTNPQMTALGRARDLGQVLGKGDMTSSLLVAKKDIYKKFKSKTNEFLNRFSTPATGANLGFVSPFSLNAVAIAPLIDLGDYIYVPNQYLLFESIYESPFYWMMLDGSYAHIHSKNRGAFLEHATAHIFCDVFGPANVFENVKLKVGQTDVGEIDVLVVYGEFAIVAQAKSKRMTMKARTGDREALKSDFEDAIQRPYQQALECIEHLRAGATAIDKNGKSPPLHGLPRYFPLVVLSDPFPAVTYLSRAMLKTTNDLAAAVWDLAVLDCVARLLPTPIDMLFYLKCRTDTFSRIYSDSEHNILGFHLSSKLAIERNINGMYLDRDFATPVDDYLISAELKLRTERPLGILERTQIPVVSEILALIKTSDPRLSSVAVDLYDLSMAALTTLSDQILALRREVASTGKAMKALSVSTASGGLTYTVTQDRGRAAVGAAELIGRKHKYDCKKDRWYVVLDSLQTGDRIDGIQCLVWPWEPDQAEAANSSTVSQMFKSSTFGRGSVTGDGE